MEDTLMKIHPSGMSEETAKGNRVSCGVLGSREAAKQDLSKYKQFRDLFASAERETEVPKSLLGAIASRESRIGSVLSPSGYGQDGHGYGMMQVDDRHHDVDKSGGPKSLQNIVQGGKILRDSISAVANKFPNWRKEQQLQGGVAAYNFGVKNVQTVSGIDRGTTGNDYSNDTIARAQYFCEQDI